jgi:hypothetical protein
MEMTAQFTNTGGQMRKKRLEPGSPEAHQAILRRIDNMSKEELEHWIERLSRPPEGVEETWRNRDLSQANGSAPVRDPIDGDNS